MYRLPWEPFWITHFNTCPSTLTPPTVHFRLDPRLDPIAEKNDLKVFDEGVKSFSELENDLNENDLEDANDLVPHFIYCGCHYWYFRDDLLKEILLTKMGKFGVQSANFTMLWMCRMNLVTKEKATQAYAKQLMNEREWKDYEKSISDDLETFFQNLQIQKVIKNEEVESFFLPKLTVDELKLVKAKNKLYLGTYFEHYYGLNPDVDAKEMENSDSSAKYVHGRCRRMTQNLALESN